MKARLVAAMVATLAGLALAMLGAAPAAAAFEIGGTPDGQTWQCNDTTPDGQTW